FFFISCSSKEKNINNRFVIEKKLADSIKHFILDSINHSERKGRAYYWQRRSDRELNSEILYEFICRYYDTENKKEKLLNECLQYILKTKGVLGHLRNHPEPLFDWYFMQNLGIGYDSIATNKWKTEGYPDSNKVSMFVHESLDTKIIGLAHGISRDSNFIKKVYKDWKTPLFKILDRKMMNNLGIGELCSDLKKSYMKYKNKNKPKHPEIGYPDYKDEWLYSFWYRRYLEGNMETVYQILQEIDEYYEKRK
ncbi:MAG: hypothetical protein ACK40K_06870, partial [Raineya sp.]